MLAGETNSDQDSTLKDIDDVANNQYLFVMLNSYGKILFTGHGQYSGMPNTNWNSNFNKPVYGHIGDGTYTLDTAAKTLTYNVSNNYNEHFIQIDSGDYFMIALTINGDVYSGGTTLIWDN